MLCKFLTLTKLHITVLEFKYKRQIVLAYVLFDFLGLSIFILFQCKHTNVVFLVFLLILVKDLRILRYKQVIDNQNFKEFT